MARASSAVGLAVVAAWLCALSPSSAHANKSVTVLGLMSEDGDDALAAQLTDALRVESAAEPAWQVAPSGPSLSQLSMAFDCELRNPRCLRQMTANLGMDLVVYGTMHREGDAVLVEAGLFDVYAARSVASAQARLAPDATPAQHQRAAQVLLSGLLGRESPDAHASTAEADAEALADEPSAEAEHEPSAAAGDDAYTTAEPDSGGRAGARRWVGYGLLGLSGAAAVMTVVSWAMVGGAAGDATFEQYRLAIGESGADVDDSCAEADARRAYGLGAADFAAVQDVCARGNTWSVLQYVFLGTALAAGAAGAIVLLTGGGDDDDARSARRIGDGRLTLSPAFDRRGGSLTARLRF